VPVIIDVLSLALYTHSQIASILNQICSVFAFGFCATPVESLAGN